ncbi:MAG: glycosyltransferase family 4 protein [Chloroflexota bacterium]
MHILSALTYYRPHYSGLTIYAERLARALVARGHRVTILTSRFDPRLKPYEVVDGVEIVRPWVWFRLSKGVIMPGMLPQALRLARQADVVNLHLPQLDAAPVAVLCRLMGRPVVLTYHCDLRLPAGAVHRLANLASDLANRVAAGAAQVIVHNSRDYAEHSPFLSRYLDKVTPVYPPVELAAVSAADLAAFRQKYDIRPGQRVIGMAARLATEKGVEFLAQALPQVLQRFPQARVLHVGPYQGVLGEEAYARRVLQQIEPVKQHWTWLGIVSPVEMAAFFQTIDVLALPSLNSTESYGLVQVEALACGAPVVVSDLPGVRVPVSQTGMGRVVPSGDAARLAQALVEVLQAAPAHEPAPAARDLIEKSTPQAAAAAYEKIFQTLGKQNR